MRVRFSDEAISRLRSIHGFVSQDSAAHARTLIDRLIRRAEEIADVPHAGREVPEYRDENMREILVRPYRIIYRVNLQSIEIITVVHYRQLLPDDLASPR